MSLAISYTDQILSRCRAFMAMQDHADKTMIKGAIEDVILDVCTAMVLHYDKLMAQHTSGAARTNKLMREMRTTWRAVIKRVTTAHSALAINERQLFVVASAYISWRVIQNPRVLVADIYQDDTRVLMNCPAEARKHCIREVLARYRG